MLRGLCSSSNTNLPLIEKDFVKKVRYFTEEIENMYTQLLTEYNSKEIEDKYSQKFEDIIMEFEKNLNIINESSNNNKKNEDTDDMKLLEQSIESSINNSEFVDERNVTETDKDDKKDNIEQSEATNHTNATKIINNNILITKSFFLQSMVKFIHVTY